MIASNTGMPRLETDEAMAQQAAINDPSGDSSYQFKAYNLNQSMTTDFEGWLKAWQDDSWISADQPDNCYVNGFPYTSIGLTGNWQYASAGSVLDQRFLSLSEFILKGRRAHLVVRSTSRNPVSGQGPPVTGSGVLVRFLLG